MLIDGVQLTSDSSARETGIDRFIVHHGATTSLDAILSLFQPGGRTVSANYAMGNDGTLILTVDEDRRAWTSASSYWDGRAVTIEVANSYAGDPWPVSDASFDKLARLIADVSQRYGFPINDDTVLGHRELWERYGDSYATLCPGDLHRRKAELLTLANHYRTNGITAGLDQTPILEEDMYLTFVTDNPAGSWYATDGITKRPLAPGGNQLLVDLGLAKWPDGIPGNVKLLSPAQIASIPTEGADIAEHVDDIAAAVAAIIPANATVDEITEALVAALNTSPAQG